MDGSTPSFPQAAAIAVWSGRICLVTSRNRKRWVVPKGRLEPGKTDRDIALQEAWEEAGLIGELSEEPLGCYSYEKAGNRYRVTVFLMQVIDVKGDWPERDKRSRCWVSPVRALDRIQEIGLRKLIRRVTSLGARARKDRASSHGEPGPRFARACEP